MGARAPLRKERLRHKEADATLRMAMVESNDAPAAVAEKFPHRIGNICWRRAQERVQPLLCSRKEGARGLLKPGTIPGHNRHKPIGGFVADPCAPGRVIPFSRRVHTLVQSDRSVARLGRQPDAAPRQKRHLACNDAKLRAPALHRRPRRWMITRRHLFFSPAQIRSTIPPVPGLKTRRSASCCARNTRLAPTAASESAPQAMRPLPGSSPQ